MTESAPFEPSNDFSANAIIPTGMRNVPCVGLLIADKRQLLFTGSGVNNLPACNLSTDTVFSSVFRRNAGNALACTLKHDQCTARIIGSIMRSEFEQVYVYHAAVPFRFVRHPLAWIDDTVVFYQLFRMTSLKNRPFYEGLISALSHLATQGELTWEAEEFTALQAA